MFDALTIDALRGFSWLGYLILFIGMVFEGESVLVVFAASARFGILYPPAVFLTAVAGVILGDAFWFFVGSKAGTFLLRRYGKILFVSESRIRVLGEYLSRGRRSTGFFIVLAKYLYGFTHMTLLSVGASGFPFRHFIIYTIPSALLWVGIFFGLGFAYAEAVQSLEDRIPLILGGLVIILIIVFLASKALGSYFEKKYLKL